MSSSHLFPNGTPDAHSGLRPSLTTWISERAAQLGFAMSGVVRAEKFPELARQADWLARGYAGEMKYLGDARRGDPSSVMAGIRSVIVCALNYNTGPVRTAQALEEASASNSASSGPRGWISRYAWGDDYHEVLRAKLELLLEALREQCNAPFEARIYADTGPLNERVLAKYAGLGWLGKNTLLLNEQAGSYFFLGVILTTLDLPPTLESASVAAADRCGSCTKCIEACPTHALVEPYVLDARRCISYLTIELRGDIPVELRGPMGQHIFGCDICQDVCPWNRRAPATYASEFQPRVYALPNAGLDVALHPNSDAQQLSQDHPEILHRESLFLPRLEWLASLTPTQFSELFRGSPIKRTKWKGLVRNVCIALGNSGSAISSATRRRIVKLLSGLIVLNEPVVRESAQWAISRIQEHAGQDHADYRQSNAATPETRTSGILP
jgi:epoxyqueuosine reductase